MKNCRWDSSRVVIKLRLIDVVNDAFSNMFSFRFIIASHPKWRQVGGDEVRTWLIIDDVIVEPCACFLVPKNRFDGLEIKNKIEDAFVACHKSSTYRLELI